MTGGLFNGAGGIFVADPNAMQNSGGTKSGGPDGGGADGALARTAAGGAAAGGASADRDGWSRGGRQFATSREVYTRSMFRICLKFTTSEDEDEGKPEPATAYWTLYGRTSTIGNGGPSTPSPDDICRRMDDSMTGPAAGVLARLTDFDGEQSALHALRAAMTTGWHIRGDRGDAAIRVGKAKAMSMNSGGKPQKEARLLSLDAERWVLCKGASFAAGNSVFNVEDVNDAKQKITVHCSKGPMRGKLIDVHASKCPYVFGRAHEADLCIMDRELSRKHGAILYLPNKSGKKNGGNFVLTDLESTVRFCLCFVSHCAYLVLRSSMLMMMILQVKLHWAAKTPSHRTLTPTLPWTPTERIVHEIGRAVRTQRHGCTKLGR